MHLKKYLFIILLLCGYQNTFAQTSNAFLVTKKVLFTGDTLFIDTVSIAPGSLNLIHNEKAINLNDWHINYVEGYMVKPPNFNVTSQLEVVYRPFNLKLNKPYYHKNPNNIKYLAKEPQNPFSYNYTPQNEAPWDLGELSKQGNISRGVSFGNNQNLSVNSNLNLQLAGKLTDNINVLAAITDENIPIQPEGNTQQLQDFDQVYIQLFDDNTKLTAGDFTLEPPNSYFMRYLKRAQGGSIETTKLSAKNQTSKTTASAAISRGKFARNIVQGVEGNQGPYRLRGAEGEPFIVILSGTERVFIDGRQLTRGQENDYIINYNTAEVTFTAKQLITKDKRIVIEFQYSVLNYQRSLFQASHQAIAKNWQLNFHFFSEQDNKNQPIQRDFSDTDRALLQNIGDSLNQAIISGIDTANFNENLVLYEKIDTTLNGLFFDSVFVFSQNRETQLYRLSFSEVGYGNGNYIQSASIANGRVYEWSPPDNFGRPTGNFEPVILIETPKQKQMVTLGGVYKKNGFAVEAEAAVTNNDLNTFSNVHQNDDIDGAVKSIISYQTPISNKNNQTKNSALLLTELNIEHWGKNFTEIERIRGVEFDRDWNIRNLKLTQSQLITGAAIGINNNKSINTRYDLKYFDAGADFTGIKNDFLLAYNKPKTQIDLAASLLKSQAKTENSEFYRHKSVIKKHLKWLTIGYRDDIENNLRKLPTTDSLSPTAYRFLEHEFFLTSPDTFKNKFNLSYTNRKDFAVKNNSLALATLGEAYGLGFDFLKNKNHQVRTKTTYRVLHIADSTLTFNRPENTLLSRIEYQMRLAKGAITSTSFYEIGSGLESRKEFTFLQVPTGQGNYAWIDYNKNGIKELNEFEIALFADQAEYIKVFFPTDNYIKTFSNQFSQMLYLTPAAIWNNQNGLKQVLSKFSNQLAFRIDRKTTANQMEERLNPFVSGVNAADSNLLAINSNFRNTLYFNRTHPVFGAEFTTQDLKSKTLLTNGFESRYSNSLSTLLRLNFLKVFTLNLLAEKGNKQNKSDFFNTRDYLLELQEIEPKFTYQPTTGFRISTFFNYNEKINVNPTVFDPFGEAVSGGEKAFLRTYAIEARWAQATKGSLNFQLNFIQIAYNGNQNSAVAFEMTEGLQTGNNLTWTTFYQRTLANNLQVDLNYTGRAAPGSKTIHTGGVQVRAFF